MKGALLLHRLVRRHAAQTDSSSPRPTIERRGSMLQSVVTILPSFAILGASRKPRRGLWPIASGPDCPLSLTTADRTRGISMAAALRVSSQPDSSADGARAGESKTSIVDDGLSAFLSVRPRLFGIASQMLGSAAEAEDIVQDVWVRWQTADRSVVRDAPAFLATTTKRLAINVIQSARSRRETNVGPWLTEPVDSSADPGLGAERGETFESASGYCWRSSRPRNEPRTSFGKRSTIHTARSRTSFDSKRPTLVKW